MYMLIDKHMYVFVETTVKYFSPVHWGDTLFTLLVCLSLAHGMGLRARLSFQENLISRS